MKLGILSVVLISSTSLSSPIPDNNHLTDNQGISSSDTSLDILLGHTNREVRSQPKQAKTALESEDENNFPGSDSGTETSSVEIEDSQPEYNDTLAEIVENAHI